MTLDINTLTAEQKEMLENWYRFSLNEKNKLVTEDPLVLNDYSKARKKKKAYEAFNRALLPITSQYTDSEQKTFAKKEKEAEKILEGKASKFIDDLCIEWETPAELAATIMANKTAFETVYASAEKQLRETLKELNNI